MQRRDVHDPKSRARKIDDRQKKRRQAEPTDALPGTAERIAEYERRASLGLEIHADGDANDDDSRGLKVEMTLGNFARVVTGEVQLSRNVSVEYRAFGRKLAVARNRAKLSLKALAIRSGISRSHLLNLEHGRRKAPSLSVLLALARVLTGGSIDALVG